MTPTLQVKLTISHTTHTTHSRHAWRRWKPEWHSLHSLHTLHLEIFVIIFHDIRMFIFINCLHTLHRRKHTLHRWLWVSHTFCLKFILFIVRFFNILLKYTNRAAYHPSFPFACHPSCPSAVALKPHS